MTISAELLNNEVTAILGNKMLGDVSYKIGDAIAIHETTVRYISVTVGSEVANLSRWKKAAILLINDGLTVDALIRMSKEEKTKLLDFLIMAGMPTVKKDLLLLPTGSVATHERRERQALQKYLSATRIRIEEYIKRMEEELAGNKGEKVKEEVKTEEGKTKLEKEVKTEEGKTKLEEEVKTEEGKTKLEKEVKTEEGKTKLEEEVKTEEGKTKLEKEVKTEEGKTKLEEEVKTEEGKTKLEKEVKTKSNGGKTTGAQPQDQTGESSSPWILVLPLIEETLAALHAANQATPNPSACFRTLGHTLVAVSKEFTVMSKLDQGRIQKTNKGLKQMLDIYQSLLADWS